MKKAVILLSGGLDSTTCLAIANSLNYKCYAISFNYDQRHVAELNAACNVAKHFDVCEHRIIDIDLSQFGGSALTDKTIAVPDYDDDEYQSTCAQDESRIPVTYVPARNTIFLSLSLAYAEVIGAFDIYIGVSSIDYSNYPDCREPYIKAFESMANLATKSSIEGKEVTLHTPLIHLSKAQTIEKGLSVGVDYAHTVSCYQLDSDGRACGRCESCHLRLRGFEQLGAVDPTHYVV